MKSKLIASLLVAAAGMASTLSLAQDTSAKSRAEVKAEAAQANKEKKDVGDVDTSKPKRSTSSKPRADVKAEAKVAAKEHAAKPGGEVMPASAPPKSAGDRPRAEVKEEAKKAAKSPGPAGDVKPRP